jgi:hypothetical protein
MPCVCVCVYINFSVILCGCFIFCVST